MPFSADALGLTFFTIAGLSVWFWLITAAKFALTRNLLPSAAADSLDQFLRSLNLSPRLPLIEWRLRSAVPWGLADLLAVLGIYVLALLTIGIGLQQMGWLPKQAGGTERLTLDERERMIVVNMVGSVLIGVVSVTVVALRSGATTRDFGLSWRGLSVDVRLGFIGFVMLAPPVYALQGLLVYFWQPSKHPLMEMFKDAPEAGFFGVLFVSAAVVAPLFEELLFRVLLQGYLEKAASARTDAREAFDETPESDVAGAIPSVDLALHIGNIEQPELRGGAAWLPISITSAIFALLHFTHGPDWIPLFFLACGMGHMYQRTHRLIPSLTVHALLNALSMWGLWVAVKGGLGAGD